MSTLKVILIYFKSQTTEFCLPVPLTKHIVGWRECRIWSWFAPWQRIQHRTSWKQSWTPVLDVRLVLDSWHSACCLLHVLVHCCCSYCFQRWHKWLTAWYLIQQLLPRHLHWRWSGVLTVHHINQNTLHLLLKWKQESPIRTAILQTVSIQKMPRQHTGNEDLGQLPSHKASFHRFSATSWVQIKLVCHVRSVWNRTKSMSEKYISSKGTDHLTLVTIIIKSK